jgi:toxin ParE1/3/4
MRFQLRPAARRDLAEIWLDTAERWSVDQAENYLTAIEARLGRICEFPESYPEFVSQHGSFRKAPSGEHLIFYLVHAHLVDVVRILHNRSDFDASL